MANKVKNEQINSQINTLINVCSARIQKQENEILKLKGQEKQLLNDLNEKNEIVSKTVSEKNEFKNNYFQSLVGKSFATNQVHYFKNNLACLEAKVGEAMTQKDQVIESIEQVRIEITKRKEELKKHSFKNEKFDYLKEVYSTAA